MPSNKSRPTKNYYCFHDFFKVKWYSINLNNLKIDKSHIMKIKLYQNDIPANLKLGKIIAIDTEAMGLNHKRDRLCLIQLSDGNGTCHLVQIDEIKSKPQNLLKI